MFIRRIPGESEVKFESVERQLYRLRDKDYPNRPVTDEEIRTTLKRAEVFDEYGRTLNKEHHFYIDSVITEDFAFHVFASFTIINMTKEHIPPEKRNYLIDATFKIVPSKCMQLLIISIEYKNEARIFLFFYHIFIFIFCQYILK